MDQIASLRIEYYDEKAHKIIGNRIGVTVKVDSTTKLQTRGKYARLCVEIYINKLLLPRYKLKGRRYKIEYEGLHMLCFGCGQFGHYVESCLEKNKLVEEELLRRECRG